MVEIGRQGAETCVRRVGQKRHTFQYGESLDIKEGRCDLASRISNWERYLLARRFDRAPRARVARHPPPRLQALRTSFAACPSRDELVLRAESPAARPSWGVEPAASIARRRRSRSCHGRRAREAAPGAAEAQKAP